MPIPQEIPLLEPKNSIRLKRMPTKTENKLQNNNKSDTKTDLDKQVMGGKSIDSVRNAFNDEKSYKIKVERT